MILAALMNSEATLSAVDEAPTSAWRSRRLGRRHRALPASALSILLLRLVADPATAEDLFQQTWVRVMESIRRYDARRSFEAWLFAVAHNLAIDYLRKSRPESLDEMLPSGQMRGDGLAATGPDPLDSLLEWERAEAVAAALRHLPAIHREVLTLRFEEDMKLEQMAEVVQVPLSTVKSRLRRALDGLRNSLDRHILGPGANQ